MCVGTVCIRINDDSFTAHTNTTTTTTVTTTIAVTTRRSTTIIQDNRATPVKKWRILLKQCSTARMSLLMATSAFRLRRKCQSSPRLHYLYRQTQRNNCSKLCSIKTSYQHTEHTPPSQKNHVLPTSSAMLIDNSTGCTEKAVPCDRCQFFIYNFRTKFLTQHHAQVHVITKEMCSQLVSQLEFNVPFQHKYGYIRDERSGMESYPYPVKEGQRYINLNPGGLSVQQPPKKGKGIERLI